MRLKYLTIELYEESQKRVFDKMDNMSTDLKEIRTVVSGLSRWKNRTIGAIAAIITLGGLVISAVKIF